MAATSNIIWNRRQNRTVIDWAIKNIFEDDNHYDGPEDDAPDSFRGPLRRVFDNHQLVNWYGIITMDKDEIDNLHYFEDSDTSKTSPIPIIIWQKSRLRQLIDYNTYMKVDQNTPINSPEDWLSFDVLAFREYTVTVWNKSTNRTPPTGNSTATATASSSKVLAFKKGIKRDPTLFPVLKTDSNFDPWRRSTETQARAQGVYEPLDSTYKPTTAEDKELFSEKQIYLTSVFEKTIKTSMGQSLFREYQPVFDAQSIYKGLCDHALNSTGADIDASDILTYLSTIKLGVGKWKGSTKDFILHFQNQARKYNSYVDKADQLSENIQKSLLENSVHPITDLRRIKETASHFSAAHGRKNTSLAQYVALLISAAQSYDKQFEDGRKSNTSRKVYFHDINTEIDDIMIPAATEQEDPTEVYDVNRAMTMGARLPKEQWQELSKISGMKELWMKMTPQAKKIILSGSENTESSPTQANQALTFPDQTSFDVAVGNAIDNHIKANYHAVGADDNNSHKDDEPDLRAMLTKRNVPPTDINRILSSSLSKQDDKAIDVAIINGKKYIRKVNVHKVLYQTSVHSQSTKTSLVDRGANGGIAGTDVRIISRSGEYVDVEGVMKHRENDIELVTCGGVTQTQRGPVILIMHQYAFAGRGNTIHSSAQMEWFKQQVNDKSRHAHGGPNLQDMYLHIWKIF